MQPTTREDIEGALGERQEGLVMSHYGTQAEVEGSGGHRQRCHLRANLGDIAAGDKVTWRAGESLGVIEAIAPRGSSLMRPDAFGKLKVVAANITQAVITLAPEPEAHANLIDRYLVVAETLNIAPLLLLNKCDLLAADHPLFTLLQHYQDLQYPVLKVSAKLGEGIAALKTALLDQTSIFVGQSGVGKSSLVQSLLPHETLKIGALSNGVKKGRHTTTQATLYHFDFGGDCIDSPGIREFGLWHLTPEDVAYGFVEFREHVNQCRFRDCHHESEPGCGLRHALQTGLISAERFASYKQILESLDAVNIQTPQP